MVQYNLSAGAIEAIMAGQECDRPVLQILGHKKLPGNAGAAERYRLLLSDGLYSHSSCMLATQLNSKIATGELDTNAVIRLDRYICNPIQPDRRVMIVLEVSVVATATEVGHKLGNPQVLRGGGSAPSGESAPPSAPASTNQIARENGGSGSHSFSATAGNRPLQPSSATNMSTSSSVAQSSNGFYSGKTNQVPASKTFAGTAGNMGGARGGGTVTGMDTPMKVYPIQSLTPYQNRWTIKVRVTQKTPIKNWSNSRGEGSLFSMNLVDESGEIRATAFKNEVDKFYNIIEVNKVYYIRKGQLKAANKQFSSVKNDYEMTFTGETEVIPCDDSEAMELPAVTFSFVPISSLESQQPGAMIDVIGVVKEVQDLRSIVTKATQKEMKKRDIVLVDESKVQINLTLWGTEAESFDGTGQPILAVKGARLSDWGGRSLSSVSNSQIILNPDIPESHRLRGWFDEVGTGASFMEYKRDGMSVGGPAGGTEWKTLGEVKAVDMQDKAQYFNVKVDVSHIKKENCMYMACPAADCNKKVIDQSNGTYRCEKCNKAYPDFKWRMLLQVNLVDFSGDLWVTCFQDTAEELLGIKADDLGKLKEQMSNGDSGSKYDDVFYHALYKTLIVKCRAKMETYNDESRLKTVCMSATPVNYKEYNQRLISDIQALLK